VEVGRRAGNLRLQVMGIESAYAQFELFIQAHFGAHLCTETLLSGLPVDDIPDSGEVFSLSVLVLKIVLLMLVRVPTTDRQLTACSHASIPSKGWN
jgi:hypothetical protein